MLLEPFEYGLKTNYVNLSELVTSHIWLTVYGPNRRLVIRLFSIKNKGKESLMDL